MYSYYLSKFYELFDTVILVLKKVSQSYYYKELTVLKKPIIFLHWYHHAIVILMVWTWIEYGIVFSRYYHGSLAGQFNYYSLGMLANTLVHVFMYYYYYLAARGKSVWFKVPFLLFEQLTQ